MSIVADQSSSTRAPGGTVSPQGWPCSGAAPETPAQPKHHPPRAGIPADCTRHPSSSAIIEALLRCESLESIAAAHTGGSIVAALAQLNEAEAQIHQITEASRAARSIRMERLACKSLDALEETITNHSIHDEMTVGEARALEQRRRAAVTVIRLRDDVNYLNVRERIFEDLSRDFHERSAIRDSSRHRQNSDRFMMRYRVGGSDGAMGDEGTQAQRHEGTKQRSAPVPPRSARAVGRADHSTLQTTKQFSPTESPPSSTLAVSRCAAKPASYFREVTLDVSGDGGRIARGDASTPSLKAGDNAPRLHANRGRARAAPERSSVPQPTRSVGVPRHPTRSVGAPRSVGVPRASPPLRMAA